MILEVEMIKDTGLRIKHKGEHGKGAKGVPSLNNQTLYAEPSSEFTKAVKSLREVLTRSTALGAFEAALEGSVGDKHLNGVEIPTLIKDTLRHVASGLTVKSLVIRYAEGNVLSAKVKGEFINKQGDAMTIASPMIRFDGEPAYGWEATFLKKVLVVIEEARNTLDGNYQRVAEPEETIEADATVVPVKRKKKEGEVGPLALPPAQKSIGDRMRAVA